MLNVKSKVQYYKRSSQVPKGVAYACTYVPIFEPFIFVFEFDNRIEKIIELKRIVKPLCNHFTLTSNSLNLAGH